MHSDEPNNHKVSDQTRIIRSMMQVKVYMMQQQQLIHLPLLVPQSAPVAAILTCFQGVCAAALSRGLVLQSEHVFWFFVLRF